MLIKFLDQRGLDVIVNTEQIVSIEANRNKPPGSYVYMAFHGEGGLDYTLPLTPDEIMAEINRQSGASAEDLKALREENELLRVAIAQAIVSSLMKGHDKAQCRKMLRAALAGENEVPGE